MVVIRTSFVGNSSSSSYIVAPPKKMKFKELIELADVDVDQDVDLVIFGNNSTSLTSLKAAWKTLKQTGKLSQADDEDAFNIILELMDALGYVCEEPQTRPIDGSYNLMELGSFE